MHEYIPNIVATDALVLKHQPSVPKVLIKYLFYCTGFVPKQYVYSEQN